LRAAAAGSADVTAVMVTAAIAAASLRSIVSRLLDERPASA